MAIHRITSAGPTLVLLVLATDLGGCLEPTSNFQMPSTTTSTSTGGSSSSASSLSDSSPGSSPSSNSNGSASDADSDTAAGSTSTTSTSTTDEGSSSGSTGEPPDNACGVKDSYPDLGTVGDSLGFFVDLGTRSIGADMFLTDSQTEPFDLVLVQLWETRPPFDDVPQPGMYDIVTLGGKDCLGLCVTIQANATFDMSGFIDAETVLIATEGSIDITQLTWDAATPENGSIAGTANDLVFHEADPVTHELIDGGCTTTLEHFSFDVDVTHVVPL